MKITYIPVVGEEKIEYKSKLPAYSVLTKFLEGPGERFELKVQSGAKVVKATMWVNEVGMLRNFPINVKASTLVYQASKLMQRGMTQYIHGNVILVQPEDRNIIKSTLYSKVKEHAALIRSVKAAVFPAGRYTWYAWNKPQPAMLASRRGQSARIVKGGKFGVRPATSKKGMFRVITEDQGPSIIFSLSEQEVNTLVKHARMIHKGSKQTAAPLYTEKFLVDKTKENAPRVQDYLNKALSLIRKVSRTAEEDGDIEKYWGNFSRGSNKLAKCLQVFSYYDAANYWFLNYYLALRDKVKLSPSGKEILLKQKEDWEKARKILIQALTSLLPKLKENPQYKSKVYAVEYFFARSPKDIKKLERY